MIIPSVREISVKFRRKYGVFVAFRYLETLFFVHVTYEIKKENLKVLMAALTEIGELQLKKGQIIQALILCREK